MSLGTIQIGRSLTAGPSAELLAKLPPDAMIDDVNAFGMYEAFTTDVTGLDVNWTVDESDAAVAYSLRTDQLGGGCRVTYTGATDEDEGWIQYPSGIVNFNEDQGRAIFEMRVKKSSIADNNLALFMGLAEIKAAGNNIFQVTDTAVMQVVSFVGFNTLHAAGETIQTSHATASGALATVQADVGTLVADTYIKLGIYCDRKEVFFFVDGVQQSSSVLLTATDFPDGILLAPTWCTNDGTGVTATADLTMAYTRQMRV